MLEAFWSYPNSCERSGSRQYQSIIFYHNEDQKKAALTSLKREAAKRKGEITTPILPVGVFTVAEDYHQKFHLRQNSDLEKELMAFYPDAKDFMNSTAAMKLNAYLAGYGTSQMLAKEIGDFGLSAAGRKKLLEFYKNFSAIGGERP